MGSLILADSPFSPDAGPVHARSRQAIDQTRRMTESFGISSWRCFSGASVVGYWPAIAVGGVSYGSLVHHGLDLRVAVGLVFVCSWT